MKLIANIIKNKDSEILNFKLLEEDCKDEIRNIIKSNNLKIERNVVNKILDAEIYFINKVNYQLEFYETKDKDSKHLYNMLEQIIYIFKIKIGNILIEEYLLYNFNIYEKIENAFENEAKKIAILLKVIYKIKINS